MGVPISTRLSVNGHSDNWFTPHDGAANYGKCFVYPYGLRNAFAVEQEIQRMASTKVPDDVILMIEVISSVAIAIVLGMILTLIGGSIYSSLVIAH
jgi:hypothetical protein